jgi:sugar (pentulose or hexulose) kinase
MRELLVGLDVGTTYCKAVVLDSDGRELAQARARTPWTPVPAGAEIDPHAVVDAVLSVAAQAIEDAPELRELVLREASSSGVRATLLWA